MRRRQVISFIGAGALARGMALSLYQQGYTIGEIVGREQAASRRGAAALARQVGAQSSTLSTAVLDCDILWLAVPDGSIEDVARTLAGRAKLPPVVLHPSGALSSTVLERLAQRGVHTASAHPMMTFVAGGSRTRSEAPGMEGVWFALEGDAVAVRAARQLARKLGARSFPIEPKNKTLYHAFGAMLSPMLAAEMEAAEQLGVRAGIPPTEVRRIMEPIVLRTVTNVLRSGAGRSFSGPLVRGDVATVAAHLKALGNSAEAKVYRALAEYATEKLPVKRGEEMKKLLRGRRS